MNRIEVWRKKRSAAVKIFNAQDPKIIFRNIGETTLIDGDWTWSFGIEDATTAQQAVAALQRAEIKLVMNRRF
jgi:hypothetical protein